MNGKDEADTLPPCLIFIDKEGRWYHQGVEMIHRDVIRMFYEHMELDARGRYVITWRGQRCYVEVEDTAFVVRSVDYDPGGTGGNERILIRLSDDTLEALAPETLWVGDGNVLYCKVKNEMFPARFTRQAYYQVAAHIREEEGTFVLPLGGRKYPIREAP
ncbi:MAG: DUF1285 domain-containing protein [Deltaproteobacteria bacterium]|nr:DUF1285 domain-containing protein [Deltaproteobacteria bacterium]MBW1924953.1 DUF1285 domain-containing protein [Deltaproteobacteria bacterium]MBW1948852.1 DUF1285 domain-containing protein [Deltaproteobacteria bacterium]MBW2006699.1 DUF1285 domain-containing protein [Deltaproteobacteria bacterium]MBW2102060.1 DUF1285 domain-containing protein [Deltaproteobacteria bacterium]